MKECLESLYLEYSVEIPPKVLDQWCATGLLESTHEAQGSAHALSLSHPFPRSPAGATAAATRLPFPDDEEPVDCQIPPKG